VPAVELFFAVQVQMDVPFLDVVEHCLFFSVYDAVDKHGPHLAQELLARYESNVQLVTCSWMHSVDSYFRHYTKKPFDRTKSFHIPSIASMWES